MPLGEYLPTRKILKFKQVELSVRGVSSEDLTRVITSRLPEVKLAATMYLEARATFVTPAGLDMFMIRLCQELPWLVAEIISAVCDEDEPADGPSLLERARKLPLPVQIGTLAEILRMTFEEAGGLKNWYAEMVRELGAMLPAGLDARSGLSSLKSAFLTTQQPETTN